MHMGSGVGGRLPAPGIWCLRAERLRWVAADCASVAGLAGVCLRPASGVSGRLNASGVAGWRAGGWLWRWSVDDGLGVVGEDFFGEDGGSGDAGAGEEVLLGQVAALGALGADGELTALEHGGEEVGQRSGVREVEGFGATGYGEPDGVAGEP